MKNALKRPLPVPNHDSRAYWDAAARQQLAYQYCNDCSRAQFPPRAHCSHCHTGKPAWKISKGVGRVYAVTVVHRAPTPAFRAAAPYALALVDFDEGFRLLLNVRGAAPESLAIGQPVRAVFEPLDDGQWLPQAEVITQETA